MNAKKYLLMAYCFYGGAAWCQSSAEKYVVFSFRAETGYSRSDLRFSIAGNEQGASPNILSELIWRKVGGVHYGAEAHATIRKRWLITTGYGRSHINSGNVSDKDYAEDNRRALFSELYASSHKGFDQYMQVQSGYTFWQHQAFTLTGSLSGRLLTQQFYLLNNKHSTADNDPLNYIEGLNSYYKTQWHALGAVVTIASRKIKRFSGEYSLGGYLSTYNAYGRWNLRDDLAQPKSYTQQARGILITHNATVYYLLSETLTVGLSYLNEYAQTGKGKDVVHYDDASTNSTQLNHVNTKIQRFNILFTYTLL